jgi:hypothetical protein
MTYATAKCDRGIILDRDDVLEHVKEGLTRVALANGEDVVE